MSRESEMVVNAIVAYKDDESRHPVVYRIIEDNVNRVIMEDVWINKGIKPQATAFKDDLRIAFVEHSDIPVPEFINFKEWQDCSWHNDVTASASLSIEGNAELYIRLWVFHDNPSRRDGLDCKKYLVCYEDTIGHMTMGEEADTDDEAIRLIESYKNVKKTRISADKWL